MAAKVATGEGKTMNDKYRTERRRWLRRAWPFLLAAVAAVLACAGLLANGAAVGY